jgi:hypothetical protein
VTGAEQILERLRAIEDELRDLAYDRLRAAADRDDGEGVGDERRILQARRAVQRAIAALGGANDG